jgi:hypothetical protein
MTKDNTQNKILTEETALIQEIEAGAVLSSLSKDKKDLSHSVAVPSVSQSQTFGFFPSILAGYNTGCQ